MIHRKHACVAAPSDHSFADLGRALKEIGALEDITDQRQRMVAQQDRWKARAIYRLQGYALPGLAEQIRAAGSRHAIALDGDAIEVTG